MTKVHQFQCDYIAGCHPNVLEALVRTNLVEVPGYGEDPFCQSAADKIRAACGKPEAAVYFFAGGTTTNLTVVAAALRPHQGVVSCDSGHVEAHETGAIEATGHKVLTLPAHEGKIDAGKLDAYCAGYFENAEKVLLVQPGMVYVSFPTETGSIYTLAELEALRRVCDKWDLYFYLDGARLAYGLAASPDVTIGDIARLTDAFYIGGTKCGTLDCEALVINHPALKKDFPALMRRQGALLSKGRLAGVQFDAIMTDDLYFEIGRKAVSQAMRLRQAFIDAGCTMAGDSSTNQQFVCLTQAQCDFMARKYRFEDCGRSADGRRVVRFCTAWSTRDDVFEELVADVAKLKTVA